MRCEDASKVARKVKEWSELNVRSVKVVLLHEVGVGREMLTFPPPMLIEV